MLFRSGRGSAAGSIVSYCLEITDIDPIRYQLLFERFLNPERVSMPDIDVDFCYERRQEVIDYVVRKYGKDQVVQIITFGTMAARAVIRDVGRVLDIPYAKVDGISKMVPNELNITIDKALKISKDLRNAYEQDEETHYLIDMSKRLEGLPRHASMHAAGVVIGKTAIDEYVPLATGADTKKMKYGHRGGNHPVKDLETGRVYISSQNHGYMVDTDTLDQNVAVPAFENVNDKTNEGLKYIGKNIFTVQFHPEACPGPQDSSYLFDRFIQMMGGNQ